MPGPPDRPRVLTFLDYYLPGFKGGGPVRTIHNLVDQLGDEIDFLIVTRDRDRDELQPYGQIRIGEWNQMGRAQVYYAPPAQLNFGGVRALMRATPHHILYLNSLFSPKMTILPLLNRYSGASTRRCILAPRGELSPGALSLKAAKKRTYLGLARRLRLFKDVTWQASSEREAADIVAAFPNLPAPPFIASDFPAGLKPGLGERVRPEGAPLRLVFLSRIVPMKNLHFALKALRGVSLPVDFHIYGPKEDPAYWLQCERIIAGLPANLCVTYGGGVEPHCVADTLAGFDLFILPSLGENFGHVIAEALQAGIPVLISDRTPWQDLAAHGAGQILPLSDPGRFAEAIERYARLDPAEQKAMKADIRSYVERMHGAIGAVVERNRRLFVGAP